MGQFHFESGLVAAIIRAGLMATVGAKNVDRYFPKVVGSLLFVGVLLILAGIGGVIYLAARQ